LLRTEFPYTTRLNLLSNGNGALGTAMKQVGKSLGSTEIEAMFVLIDGFETYGLTEPWTLEVRHK